jgi:hypothetical protein
MRLKCTICGKEFESELGLLNPKMVQDVHYRSHIEEIQSAMVWITRVVARGEVTSQETEMAKDTIQKWDALRDCIFDYKD